MTCIKESNDCSSTTYKNFFQNESEIDSSNISIYWRNLNYEVRSTTPLFNVVNRVFKRRSPSLLSSSAQCSSQSDVHTNYKSSKRMILNQLNGSFASGTLNALMGPSGAGKTTLLNILSYAITDGVTRQYYCNNSGLTPEIEFISSTNRGQNATNACYIEQHVDDSIAGRLTVGEILRYAYCFKNYRRGREGEGRKFVGYRIYMNRHIAQTLTDLMLPPEIVDRRFEQCSGGERKRIAIGQELMSIDRRPDFLFIDEPTTGLDSSSAYEVILALRRLTTITANKYRRHGDDFDVDGNDGNLDISNHYCPRSVTIIASIHSPSVEILAMFDQLYVLARNGVAIYSGPPNEIGQTIKDLIGNNIENCGKTQCPSEDDDNDNDKKTCPIIEQPPIEVLIKIANDTESDEENIHKLAQFTANRETIKIDNALQCKKKHKNLSQTVRDNVDDKSGVDPSIISVKESNDQRIERSGKRRNIHKAFCVGDLVLQIQRLFRIDFVANFYIFLNFLIYQVVFLAYLATIFSSGAEMVRPNGCFQSLIYINQTNDNRSDMLQDFSQKSSSKLSCHLDSIAAYSLIRENYNYLSTINVLICFCAILSGTVTFASFAKMFRNEYRNRWYSFSSVVWPTVVVSMLEWTIYSLVITICAYFFTEQYAADQSATEDTIVINWHRLSLFGATIWLTLMYLQSLGQMIGSLFMDSSIVATMSSCVVYVIYFTFSDQFIKVDELQSAPIRAIANMIAAKYQTRLLLFTIYGIDRCESYDQSAILQQNYIDPTHITFYVFRIVQNIILLRLVTLAVIFVKFNRFPNIAKRWSTLIDYLSNWWGFQNLTNIENQKTDNEIRSQIESISVDVEKRNLTENDLAKFESSIKNFVNNLHGKPIIAFRNLYLYKPSLIFDQRYRAQPLKTFEILDKNPNKNITKNEDNNNIGDCDAILQNLSGAFYFGTLNALMGPSGAGKTSLLNVLNGQFGATGQVSGSFYLSKYAHLVTRFIAQNIDHHLISGLTVRQLLIYASRFKNIKNNLGEVGNDDAHVPFDHDEIADRVAHQFNLQHIAHTPVDACSGGERKRLALAMELTTITSHTVSNLEIPNLIFIDEPTSGLDSRSAEMVISCLHKLTRSLSHSMTIIASIHQPTTDILNRIDHIYMLAYGGICIFDGSPSSMNDTIEMFSRQNGTNAQPSSLLAASQQLTRFACRGGCPKDIILQLANVDKFDTQNMIEIETHCRPRILSIGRNRSPRIMISDIVTLMSRYVTCFLGSMWLWEWMPLAIAITIYGINVLILFPARDRMASSTGCINPAEDDLDITHCDDSQNTLDRRAKLKLLQDSIVYIFFCLINILTFVTFYSVLIFMRDLRHFAVEHRNGWYSSGSFYIMKTVTDIVPMLPILVVFVYIVDIYDESTRPGYYAHSLLVTVLLLIAAQSISNTIVLIGNQNFKITFILLLLVFQTFLSLCNIPRPVNRLHYLYQTLSLFNPARFAVEAIILLQYGFGRCDYSIGQVQPLLYTFDLQDADYAYDIAMIVANIVFYRIIAFVLLLRSAKS